LVGNIFAFVREATFVSAIKANVSRYGRQETFEQTLKITNISAKMFLTFGQGFSLTKYLICSLIV
jgi:uncharacterized membrane protein